MRLRDQPMIRINRGSAPQALSTSKSPRRFACRSVVSDLHAMQHGKCCYCEQRIAGATLGKHVEHYRPQSLFPCLRNNWRNLLLSCADCNGAKSNRFPVTFLASPLILDPSDPKLNPEDHIEFNVGRDQLLKRKVFARARISSLEGQYTIKLTRLNRTYLLQNRGERLDHIWCYYIALLTETARLSNGSGCKHKLNRAKQRLREFAHPTSNYAGVARSFARVRQLWKHGV